VQMERDFAIPRRFPHMFIVNLLAQFEGPTINKDDLEAELGTGTTSYVVMSLASKTLGQFVDERPPLEERHVLLLLLQLATAIAFLNNHGVAHRDLKLDNIVITSMGKVMLIDFGEACDTLTPMYGAGNAMNRPPEITNTTEVRTCSYMRGCGCGCGCGCCCCCGCGCGCGCGCVCVR